MNANARLLRLAAASALCVAATQADAAGAGRVAYAPYGAYSHQAWRDGAVWPRIATGTLQERWDRPVHYVNDRPDIGSWRPVDAIQEDYDQGPAYARRYWRPYFDWRVYR
ncbi:hypothetical protein [Methylocella sp.]|uniref:hypothetical protein n=1 Tax=Methylocella sp. TaxID=1978226 RepID=UPI003782E6B4